MLKTTHPSLAQAIATLWSTLSRCIGDRPNSILEVEPDMSAHGTLDKVFQIVFETIFRSIDVKLIMYANCLLEALASLSVPSLEGLIGCSPAKFSVLRDAGTTMDEAGRFLQMRARYVACALEELPGIFKRAQITGQDAFDFLGRASSIIRIVLSHGDQLAVADAQKFLMQDFKAFWMSVATKGAMLAVGIYHAKDEDHWARVTSKIEKQLMAKPIAQVRDEASKLLAGADIAKCNTKKDFAKRMTAVMMVEGRKIDADEKATWEARIANFGNEVLKIKAPGSASNIHLDLIEKNIQSAFGEEDASTKDTVDTSIVPMFPAESDESECDALTCTKKLRLQFELDEILAMINAHVMKVIS